MSSASEASAAPASKRQRTEDTTSSASASSASSSASSTSGPSTPGDDITAGWTLVNQGAEARVWALRFGGREAIAKDRFKKAYRHEVLDAKLTLKRVLTEARCMMRCRRAGLDTPGLLMLDTNANRIYMERCVATAHAARHRRGPPGHRSAATLPGRHR